MSKANGAPLTRAEFFDAMDKIDKRFDGIDKTLALIVKSQNLIVEVLQIQDRQIHKPRAIGAIASRGKPK